MAQGCEFAQFVALFGVGYLDQIDEQAAHKYLVEYVNKTQDAELCTYLVRKCDFTAEEFTVSVGKRGTDASQWN